MTQKQMQTRSFLSVLLALHLVWVLVHQVPSFHLGQQLLQHYSNKNDSRELFKYKNLRFQIPPGTCGLTCTVFDTLAVNPTFSTLVTAIRAAGLVERLSGPDPVTVFAPTNAAFDILPPVKLQVSIYILLG